jgi:signal transduction histidine kinase
VSTIERYPRTGVLVKSWLQSVRHHLMARVGRSHAGISSIRGALVAGFAVLIGLWAFAGFELIRSLGDVEHRVKAEHDAFADAADTVSLIRRNVFEASINVRDALIDADPQARDDYRAELREFREAIQERMATYLHDVASHEERGEWTKLRAKLDEYWTSLEFVFADDLPTSTTRAATMLRRNVRPIRQDVLTLLDNLRGLQQASRRQHDADVARLYAEARKRFFWIVAGALLLGVGAAWFAVRHIAGLEREIHRQRLAETHNRLDLERLSARLVDAQEAERRSLARELHDEVGQALTAIKMSVGVAMRTPGTPARARAALEEARAVAETTLQGVRDLSQLLHPSMLDDFGLPETLAAYLRNFSKRTGIRAYFSLDGIEERLPPDVEVCIYRIVQEALTNVARHSGALACEVSLRRLSNHVELVIEDSGRGMALTSDSRDAGRGLGLMGMRERAQALDGRFVLANRAEGGTRIVVTLPAAPGARSARKAG